MYSSCQGVAALLLLLLGAAAAAASAAAALNGRPVVGVLTQPLSDTNSSEILVASYVKWIEASGARVVPLRYTASDEELLELAGSVNAVLFPGGNVGIRGTQFAHAAGLLLNATAAAGARDPEGSPPLWATCLGFEQVMLYSSAPESRGSVLRRVDAENIFVPLRWVPGALRNSSRFGGRISVQTVATLGSRNVTINMHEWGVLWDDWEAGRLPRLAANFRVLATSNDRAGKTFVALAEHRTLPFFLSQFHPEKTAFEWSQGHPDFVHTAQAVRAMQDLGDAFVERARRNHNAFASDEDLRARLIYNWSPSFVGRDDWVEQLYFF